MLTTRALIWTMRPHAHGVSSMRPTLSFRTIRFALVALFAAGGLLVWGELAPVDGVVSVRVPPSIRTPTGSIKREAVRKMLLVVRSAEGEIVARSEQFIDNGLQSPVTPPLSMRLPRGEYVVLATLITGDNQSVTLPGSLALEADGYHRVDLQRP